MNGFDSTRPTVSNFLFFGVFFVFCLARYDTPTGAEGKWKQTTVRPWARLNHNIVYTSLYVLPSQTRRLRCCTADCDLGSPSRARTSALNFSAAETLRESVVYESRKPLAGKRRWHTSVIRTTTPIWAAISPPRWSSKIRRPWIAIHGFRTMMEK